MPIHDTTLNTIAGLYNTSLAQMKAAQGGHATLVYAYTGDQKNCILRVTPPNPDIDLPSMRSILEWLAFLADRGGPVARPLRSRKGNLIEQIDQENETYLAVSFEKAPGVLAEGMAPDDWSDALFQALGSSLGLCHHIAQEYIPACAEYKRPEWNMPKNCFHPAEDLDGAEPVILEKYEQVLASIQALPKDRESYGLAHLDLHFGNFFVDAERQKISFFDFDDCAYGWYVMDIAMLLFDVLVVYNGVDRQQFGARFLENLLQGYRQQKTICPDWVSRLPLFLKLLEIDLYLMVYRFYDPTHAGDEWVAKFMPGRRERIVQETPYVDFSFDNV